MDFSARPALKSSAAAGAGMLQHAMRRKAEARLRKRQHRRSKDVIPTSHADSLRLLHELQVHQIELEMQNTELQDARDRTDRLLEKYTDLYDFAPVGYLTLDSQGRIQEVNLAWASLLGTERSRLINQRLARHLTSESQTDLVGFLARLFSGSGKQACEVSVVKGASVYSANLHGELLVASGEQPKTCRVVLSDISAHKKAEAAQHRLAALAASILTLEHEIAQHKETEGTLRKSRRRHINLLARSRQMQELLRSYSHQVLSAQDDEHRQISRELYAVISQSLAGIILHLETIKQKGAGKTRGFDGKINGMKRIVEDSMEIVDRFSRKFHPTALDDLGLIPAVRAYAQSFFTQTRIAVRLEADSEVERVSLDQKTALYHVVQEALTNLARHTRTKLVRLEFSHTDLGTRMKISYDGISARSPNRSRASRTKELELLAMSERLEMVGGSFRVESSKGGGTTLIANIPSTRTLPDASSPTSERRPRPVLRSGRVAAAR